VFSAAKDGYFLPPQIIYQGKLTAAYQQQNFGWHITYTANQWADEKITY